MESRLISPLTLEDRIALTEQYLVDLKAQLVERNREIEAARNAGVDELREVATRALAALEAAAVTVSPEFAQRTLGDVVAPHHVESFPHPNHHKD